MTSHNAGMTITFPTLPLPTIIKAATITAFAVIMTPTFTTTPRTPQPPAVIPVPHCYPCGKLTPAEIPMPNPNSPKRPTIR